MSPRISDACMITAAVMLMAAAAGNSAGQQVPADAVEIPQAVLDAAGDISVEALRRDLFYLASDELGGRRTPSVGLDRALAYVSERVGRFGLRPGGDDGGYLQHYVVERHRVDTLATAVEVGGRTFRFGRDFLLWHAPADTPVTGRLAWVGHGQVLGTRGFDPYEGIDHEGRIMVAWGPAWPPGLTAEERSSPGNGDGYVWRAPGVIWIPPFHMLTNWLRVIRDADLRPEWDFRPGVTFRGAPWIAAGPALIEALFAGEAVSAAEVFGRSMAEDLPASFAFNAEKEVRIVVAREATIDTLNFANVVAYLEGSDPELRREVITIQAHLDGAVAVASEAIFRDRHFLRDTIFNAADDNASGTVAALAIAEALARAPRPKRSILFLWDTAEERGLLGTRHYLANPVFPVADMAVHINLDMIGGTRVPADTIVANADMAGPDEVYVIGPRALSSALEHVVLGVNDRYLRMQYNSRYDTWESEFLYPRADHAPFLQRGVPVVSFFTGLHERYHSSIDNPEDIDLGKLERIARTAFVTAWMLADMPVRPVIDRPARIEFRRPE